MTLPDLIASHPPAPWHEHLTAQLAANHRMTRPEAEECARIAAWVISRHDATPTPAVLEQPSDRLTQTERWLVDILTARVNQQARDYQHTEALDLIRTLHRKAHP